MLQPNSANIRHRWPAGKPLVNAHKMETAQTGNFGEPPKSEIVGQPLPYIGTNPADQPVIFGIVGRTDCIMSQGKLQQRLAAGTDGRRFRQITILGNPIHDLMEPATGIKDTEWKRVRRAIPAKGEEPRSYRIAGF